MSNPDPFVDGLMADLGGWSNDPKDWAIETAKAAKHFNLPPDQIWGLIQTETNGNPSDKNATSGATGLTQFMPKTAASKASDGQPYVDNPYNPIHSIWGTAALLRDTMNQQKVDLPTAMRMYDGGIKPPNNAENLGYVPKVTANAQQWAKVAPSPEDLTKTVLGGTAPSDPLADSLTDDLASHVKGMGAPPSVAYGEHSGTATPQGQGAMPQAPQPPGATPLPQASATPAPQASATLGATPAPLPWGPAQQALDRGTFGLYGRLGPAIDAGINSLQNGTNFGDNYSVLRSGYAAGQKQYEDENPGQNALVTGLSQIPATMMGLGLAGRAAGAVGGAVSDAVPALGPAVGAVGRFLGGTAGQGTAGARTLGQLDNFMAAFGQRALRLGSQAANGAVGGGLAAGADAASDGRNPLVAAEEGAGTGAVLGPLAGTLSNVLSPQIKPGLAQLATRARQYGVDLPLGALAPNTLLGKSASPAGQDVLDANTSAAGEMMGLRPSDTLTNADIKNAKATAGETMDRARPLMRLNTYTPHPTLGINLPDPEFYNGSTNLGASEGARMGLNGIQQAYKRTFMTPQLGGAPVIPNPAQQPIQQALGQVQYLAKRGQINGNEFHALTSQDSPIGLMKETPGPQQRYGKLLDQLLSHIAMRDSPPAVASNFQQASQHYAVASDLDDAVNASTQTGTPNPRAIAGALKDAPDGSPSQALGQWNRLLPSTNAQGNVRTPFTPNALFDLAQRNAIPALGGALGGGGTAALRGDGSFGGALLGAALPLAGKFALNKLANNPTYRRGLVDISVGNTGTDAAQTVQTLLGRIKRSTGAVAGSAANQLGNNSPDESLPPLTIRMPQQ